MQWYIQQLAFANKYIFDPETGRIPLHLHALAWQAAGFYAQIRVIFWDSVPYRTFSPNLIGWFQIATDDCKLPSRKSALVSSCSQLHPCRRKLHPCRRKLHHFVVQMDFLLSSTTVKTAATASHIYR